ncbi:uncharacterized protein METZ01_LOCUS332653, partial [marine metagenome]
SARTNCRAWSCPSATSPRTRCDNGPPRSAYALPESPTARTSASSPGSTAAATSSPDASRSHRAGWSTPPAPRWDGSTPSSWSPSDSAGAWNWPAPPPPATPLPSTCPRPPSPSATPTTCWSTPPRSAGSHGQTARSPARCSHRSVPTAQRSRHSWWPTASAGPRPTAGWPPARASCSTKAKKSSAAPSPP